VTAALAHQARRDRVLRQSLDADPAITFAVGKVRERTSGWGVRPRRDLLAGAVRLTRTMAPTVAEALARCREALGWDRPVEVYVRPDPQFNAFLAQPPSGPTLIGLSSRLLESFSPPELRFVLGHELGHALCDHFGIPMPLTAMIEDMAGSLVPRTTQLQLFVWSRAAEVSADRMGLLCARDERAAASAFFKMATGLSSVDVVKPDLAALAAQADALPSAPAARVKFREEDDELFDCFSTHPMNPVRVRALMAYARSEGYLRAVGAATAGALATDALEDQVERDLGIMEPSYLEEDNDQSRAMRKLLYCAGLEVAAANGVVTDKELLALRALLGHDDAPRPDADLARNRTDLDEALAAAKELPALSRAQLVQHLGVIAHADGEVDEHEVEAMLRIAARLDVPAQVVHETVHAAVSPLD
jgi:uncharacterized tellurite resistance protein B-like protein